MVLGLATAAFAAGAIWTAASPSLQAASAAETQVSAAALGVFPSGTSFNGVQLQGSSFGIGVVVYPNGSALGDFEIVLTGTSVLRQPQSITLEAEVDAGSANADGSVTLSGNGTLDLGDGSLPTTVPFSAVATASGLQLTIGTTPLPTQTLSDGSIYIGG